MTNYRPTESAVPADLYPPPRSKSAIGYGPLVKAITSFCNGKFVERGHQSRGTFLEQGIYILFFAFKCSSFLENYFLRVQDNPQLSRLPH